MKITVKKLWHGSISIRDYIVNEAIKSGEEIIVLYQGKKMTLYSKDLPKGKYTNVKSKSKFTGQEYSLVDFPWNPDMF